MTTAHATLEHQRTRKFVIIARVVAVLIAIPPAWFLSDRDPPQIRLRGKLIPVMVERTNGQITRVERIPGAAPNVVKPGSDFLPVWRTTRRERVCRGYVQIEMWDRKGQLWPRFYREAAGQYEHDPLDPTRGRLVAPPVSVPKQAEPGTGWTYRVITFWYCNRLQWWLHERGFDWPIVQVGPDIPFEVAP